MFNGNYLPYISYPIVMNSMQYAYDGCPKELAIVKSCDDVIEAVNMVRQRNLEAYKKENKTDDV